MRHNLSATLCIARATWREIVRSKVLWAGLLFALFLLLLALAAGSVHAAERQRLVLDVGLGAQSFVGSAVAIAVAIAYFGLPLHNGQIYPYLVRPLPRAVFVVGRLLGIWAVLAFLVLSMAGATAAVLRAGGTPITSVMAAAALLGMAQVGMVAALTCCCCSLASTGPAALYSSAAVLLGFVSAELPQLAERQGNEAMGHVLRGAYYVLPDLAKLSLRSAAANDLLVPAATVPWALLYALLYMLVALLVTVMRLNRRQVL